MDLNSAIEESVTYLLSEDASRCLEADSYWPKWSSPWWHMSLLHELGETKRIPECCIRKLVNALNKLPLKIFPIIDDDFPDGLDPSTSFPCHCQVGNIYQVLWTWGINVDEELSWMRPFMLRYQMSDGGLNCDNDAYRIKEECPSSMVGTIAVFEALVFCTSRSYTTEELHFIDNAASFLINRKLSLGSSSIHNAEERDSAVLWSQLCFPRYYFYDILRGLNAILKWAVKFKRPIPAVAIDGVIAELSSQSTDGTLVIQRQAYAGKKTRRLNPEGKWERGEASTFSLLDEVSQIGHSSPSLFKQWQNCQSLIGQVEFV